jgi:malonyl-ACP O-methyltransferase BioC
MKEKIKSSFDGAYKTYDSVSEVHVLSSAHLAGMLKDTVSPQTILDVGCGTGNTSAELMKLYPDAGYTLCDLSENMISQALLKIKGARCIICDAENYDFTENYDLVVSNLAMQWFESIDAFLEKILKNCRCFAFSTLLDGSFSNCPNLLDNSGYPPLEELKRICRKHGKLVKCETKRYDLSFETPFGLARYFKKLGAAYHSSKKNIPHSPNGQEINLNYDLAFAIVVP